MKKILLLLLLPIITFAQKEVIIHINTDAYPSETRWVLHSDSLNGPILGNTNYGYYTQSNTSHSDTLYISDTLTNVTFVIYDSYGDGIMSPGSYFVSICGDTIVNYPSPSFTTGLISNRVVPQCMPNPPTASTCVPAVVNINLDQFQSETTWDIKDSTGALLYAGGPYSTAPDYQPQFEPVCLPLGSVTFTIYDSYGDGLAGSLWGGNDGSYYLMQCGDTLVHGTVANFGADSAHTFISDTCVPPPLVPGCMDPDYVEYNHYATIDDSSCATLKIYGCIDSTMYNYDSTANTMDYIDSCGYTLTLHDLAGNGWVGSYLEIYQEDTTSYNLTSGFNQTFAVQLKAPCPVSAKFFITAQASGTALECGFTLTNPLGDTIISVVPPFIIPFHLYTGTTNCGNSCIEKVFGCPDTIACNYTAGVNTPTSCTYPVTYYNCNNECISDIDNDGVCNELEIKGCQDPTMFNYSLLATDPDTCEPFIYGCIDPLMFNYNPLANTDNGNCEPYVFGCTDSTMFNYNPLANADNSSCTPFIYGCTDPSMLNYNPLANTENFTCVAFVYGCTDSTALNYDTLANTENGSCIERVTGCMDLNAYNYNPLANVVFGNDSLGCLYAANCTTGPGNPYWLNDPCYAWVISVDDYCCENEWDTICQLTYNYCDSTWVGPIPTRKSLEEALIVYPNPTKGKININKNVDVSVFSILGDMIISKQNINVLDVTILSPGTVSYTH